MADDELWNSADHRARALELAKKGISVNGWSEAQRLREVGLIHAVLAVAAAIKEAG